MLLPMRYQSFKFFTIRNLKSHNVQLKSQDYYEYRRTGLISLVMLTEILKCSQPVHGLPGSQLGPFIRTSILLVQLSKLFSRFQRGA